MLVLYVSPIIFALASSFRDSRSLMCSFPFRSRYWSPSRYSMMVFLFLHLSLCFTLSRTRSLVFSLSGCVVLSFSCSFQVLRSPFRTCHTCRQCTCTDDASWTLELLGRIRLQTQLFRCLAWLTRALPCLVSVVFLTSSKPVARTEKRRATNTKQHKSETLQTTNRSCAENNLVFS